MRRLRISALVACGVCALLAIDAGPRLAAADGGAKIAVTDDCDPNADWGPGGCLREEGSVTRAEFRAFTFSPLIPIDPAAPRVPVGHPSWRIAPGFLALEQGQRLRVANTGGRGHTFTEVVDYGGGFIAGLNGTPTPAIAVAPECAAIATDPTAVIAPGAMTEITGLSVGNHKFQCCIHNWMHADVKVVPES